MHEAHLTKGIRNAHLPQDDPVGSKTSTMYRKGRYQGYPQTHAHKLHECLEAGGIQSRYRIAGIPAIDLACADDLL